LRFSTKLGRCIRLLLRRTTGISPIAAPLIAHLTAGV
jgi:hypothetical protein